MRTQLHPRDYQVIDLFHRGVKGRMVAATVGINIWRVRWLRFRIALQDIVTTIQLREFSRLSPIPHMAGGNAEESAGRSAR